MSYIDTTPGETVRELTMEFGVPAAHVEDAIRVASRRAA